MLASRRASFEPRSSISGKKHASVGFPAAAWFRVVEQSNINRLVSNGAVGDLLGNRPLLWHSHLNFPGRSSETFVVRPTIALQLRLSSGGRTLRTSDMIRKTERMESGLHRSYSDTAARQWRPNALYVVDQRTTKAITHFEAT
ncbi:hypothetical protein K461DRAFT_34044 [Myriangium duriaei CBS 260.36]|uniref:Uncharacterized protein n=1 Tax=Myriangium duriaei CBS 260.36 TaxID=1168546 RepID=A0A9P4IXS4_9PEZI|nr:hypothetical protein K461DRAFT_34044 [Myriangium duriaei CBS 260.36]